MFNKREYDRTYAKEHYEQFKMDLPKGMKEKIMAQAKEKGYKSTKEYILDLIERDKSRNVFIDNHDGGNINIQ